MSVARTSAQGESIDATLFALTGVGGSFRGHRPWSHHDALTMTDERVCVWTISRGSKTLAGVADWLPDLSPAAAVEVLSERGLWPWAPGDANAPRWFCEMCQGTRLVGGGWVGTEYQDTDLCETCGREDLDATGGVTADGTTADPPSLAALVAVASRGPETLRGVAELVRELRAVTRGETGATLVWRVMTQEALKEHHERRRSATVRRGGEFLCATFSACVLSGEWAEAEDIYGTDHRPLHALADCGVHIVAGDKTRVVIAVEAL